MNISDIRIIGIIGMPGAKKTFVATLLQDKYHIPFLTISDLLKEEIIKMGRDESRYKTFRETGKELKVKFGKNIFAKKLVPRIEKLGTSLMVVDGIRDYEEAKYLKKIAKEFYLVSIHASIHTRFNRSHAYPWVENLYDFNHFKERDWDDLRLGLGNAIALADYILVNEKYFPLDIETQIDNLYEYIQSRVE